RVSASTRVASIRWTVCSDSIRFNFWGFLNSLRRDTGRMSWLRRFLFRRASRDRDSARHCGLNLLAQFSLGRPRIGVYRVAHLLALLVDFGSLGHQKALPPSSRAHYVSAPTGRVTARPMTTAERVARHRAKKAAGETSKAPQ